MIMSHTFPLRCSRSLLLEAARSGLPQCDRASEEGVVKLVCVAIGLQFAMCSGQASSA